MTLTGGIYLGLGSNLGKPEENIQKALSMLKSAKEICLIKTSSLYSSRPWGVTNQPWFINAACEIDTSLQPEILLKKIKNIEKKLGRDQNAPHWGPRIIDIDIILYRNIIIKTPELKVPHLYCTGRLFVLKPIIEIAPDIIHPVTQKKFRDYILEITEKESEETCSPYNPKVKK
jgi:2-amino-4-hydroxy-6-hydroxymethyldihydropteridine diphosphokinase